MSVENRIPKRKNRFYRWLVMALTVALLAGQSHVFVLAEEGDVPPTEISSEEPREGEDTSVEEVDGEEIISENELNEEEIVSENELDEEETVSENDLDEETDIVVLAEDDVETFEGSNGIKYRVTDDDQVEVIGHKDGSSVSGELVIPKTVTNDEVIYQVTSIGEKAFYYCDNLSYVEIPDSVISIEKSAFQLCSKLSSIKIPNSVVSIGDWAFSHCLSAESVEISDSVTSIGEYAFNCCSSLSSLEIPDSVTNIGEYAFHYCLELNSLKISNGLTDIEKGAFESCRKLSSVKIPNGITRIGVCAFAGCINLDSVDIPISVKDISYGAFFNSGLRSVEIPDSVTSIGESAFGYCGSLRSVEIPDSVITMEGHTFYKCSNLERIKIPKSITAIEEWTFFECIKLKEMQIVVSSSGEFRTLEIEDGQGHGPFEGIPNDRSIVFLAEDGSELTGPLLEKVKRAYLDAGKYDDDPDDGKWYGWSVGELTGAADTYTVTIHVNKDGQEWSDHGRTFALLPNGGGSFITDLTQVPNGNYRIYDLTGVNPDSYFSRAVDMGVNVTVKDGNTGVEVTVDGGNPEEKNVDYYTVTFYDDTIPYGEETPQRPQIVLNGKTAAKPTDPAKAGYQFTGWKTTNGGNTSYDFEHDNTDQAVPKITSIYASWKLEGGHSGGGDNDNSGDGSDDGGDSGGDGDDSGGGEDNSGGGSDDGGNSDSGGTEHIQNIASADNGKSAGDKEPKTGDASHAEVYATVTMIAGLTYLLLYFMEEGRGMTEREKEVFVAAFIRWAKKGGAFRRCCAMAAIFCLLVYYHSVGKRTDRDVINEKYLEQVS